MANPVPGYKVTTAFGVPGSWAAGKHTGEDYAAPMGTKVVAARSGKVVKTGYSGDYGNQIVIESGGIRHSYNHLSAMHVQVGQQVSAGQRVGSVGSTGRSTGPHLHYEERVSPFGYHNYRKPEFSRSSSTSGGASSTGGPYVTKDIYSDRLGFGQKDSDTVKELQERLNRIKLKGGTNLPITGNYGPMTDKEVRLWQEQVCGDKPDAAERSYLGPKQMRRMFGTPPYTIHDRGLPAIAGSNAGGGSTGGSTGGGGTDPPAVVAWHVAPSLVVLRDEVDTRWPNRDKSSDGTIGDYAHSTSKSEHNPVGHKFGPQFGTPGAVHAMDITAKGIDAQLVLDSLIGDGRVWYVIHAGSIWSKTYNWAQRDYNGSNPHDTHIHVSLAADDQDDAVANENAVGSWLQTDTSEPPESETPEPEYVTREEFDEWRENVADAIRPGGDDA